MSTTALMISNIINGPGATTVRLTADTRCYNGVRFRNIAPKTPKVVCSTIAVGNRIEVDGIYSDIQKTLIGPYAQIVVHPRD